jgi:cellulose biosynthesis protein BcsQ
VTVPVVAVFNNKGGVGKTSLIYHLAWMYADLGMNVLAADLDPQANLTAAFLDEEKLESLSPDDGPQQTVFGALEPSIRGVGDIVETPNVEQISDHLYLLPGDLSLTRFEDSLAEMRPKCFDESQRERAFRVTSAFWRILQRCARSSNSSLILADIGPNLGAINRAAMVASDFVVVPLAPDLFSLQGLRNLGPTLIDWREGWRKRLKDLKERQENRKEKLLGDLELPAGSMQPVGYVVMQHAVRLDRPVKAYEKWMQRIPGEYSKAVAMDPQHVARKNDPNRIGDIKHFRSLVPLAQEARKPIFHLKTADGAIGSHATAVEEAREAFLTLAREVARRCKIELPSRSRESA